MLLEFESNYDSSAGHPGRNLRELIEKTPEAKADILESIRRGNLEQFESLDDSGAVGSYSAAARALAVSLEQLKIADKNVQAANTLRMTLGHELQHGVNRQDIIDQDMKLRDEAAVIARGPSPHDYTAILRDYNVKSRELESMAEIAGINTLADSVRRDNPGAMLKDLYDAAPYDMAMYINVDMSKSPVVYTPRPGLIIGDDLKIDSSREENVEAVGQLFYDANGYPEQEVSGAIDIITYVESQARAAALANDPLHGAPEIHVDLKALGVSDTLPLPLGFTNASKPRLEQASVVQGQGTRAPDSPGHPDHDYYRMLRERLPDSVPDNAVAYAMYLAKADGMTDPSKVDANRISYVNGNVWVFGTVPGYRVGLDPAQSPQMTEVIGQLDEQRAQQQAQQQIRGPTSHSL
ncbi:hypothetical protein EBB59_08205 [Lysobacter pythonis]|uniref:Uncharacterized protein n=2 Tax=Solilutibacter pythonis TaxID=2483112 RepID=A0A3M2HS85_9GAMM|nr:hypothetical protein EBB59_08205 [Lysobacter pythonis]